MKIIQRHFSSAYVDLLYILQRSIYVLIKRYLCSFVDR